MTDPDNSATVRFSTTDLPEHLQLATSHKPGANIKPDGDVPFEASLAERALPGLRLCSVRFPAARILRTREMAADGNDDLYLFVNRTGDITVSARGRDVRLGENDAVLFGGGEAVAFDRHTFGESITARIPYSMLSPMVVDVDDAVMHRIPSNTAALRLLTGYAYALLDEDDAMTTPAHRLRVATHMHDLAALALGATLEAADAARNRGLAGARLRAAKVYAIDNIGSREISVGSAALHLGLTKRYLQRLFELDGTTFSEFVLRQRLARAYRMLTELQAMQRQISEIAYDVGFGDLSYFNRCFRRVYGATPMDIRGAARK